MKLLKKTQDKMSKFTTIIVIMVNIILVLKMGGVIDGLIDALRGRRYYRPSLVRCAESEVIQADLDVYFKTMKVVNLLILSWVFFKSFI